MMRYLITACCLSLFGILDISAAPSTLETEQAYIWSENTGYLNAGDANYGLLVKASHLLGHAWSASIGWILFGDGPKNQATYQQTDADIGVNRSTNNGALTGYAWSENTGWIHFDGSASMDNAGNFSGFAWGENIGWISLGSLKRAPDNEWDGLKDSLDPDDDNDLLPDNLDATPFDSTNGLADDDVDGQNNGREYVAGTDPNDPASIFRVKEIGPTVDGFRILWESVPGKSYRILTAPNLTNDFTQLGSNIIADSIETEVLHPNASSSSFYQIEVLE